MQHAPSVCACRLPLCKEAGHLHWTRRRRRNRIVLTYWTEHLFRARHAIWTSALRRALSLVCTFWHSLVIQMAVETHNAQGFHWCLYKQAVSVLGDTWELLPFHGGDCFHMRVTSLPWWWLLCHESYFPSLVVTAFTTLLCDCRWF